DARVLRVPGRRRDAGLRARWRHAPEERFRAVARDPRIAHLRVRRGRQGLPPPRRRSAARGRMKTRSTLRRVAACAVAGALLASSIAQAAEPLKLLVWINPDKGYNGLQKIGDLYAKDTGVQVLVQHPDDAPSKFQAAAGAGKGPDIFCWPHDRAGEWAKSGLIVPVKPRKELHDAIEDSAWQAFQYQGRTWGYPLSIEAI